MQTRKHGERQHARRRPPARLLRHLGLSILGVLVVLGCLAAPAGVWAAEEIPVDQLVQELRGQAPAGKRSGKELRAAYDRAIAELVKRAAGEVAQGTNDCALALQEICFRASRPGAGRDRAAACKAMLPFLDPGTPGVMRLWVLRQLERIGGSECVPAVAALLGDQDPLVRERALRILQTVPDASAVDALRSALERATDPSGRAALILALGYRRDAGSINLMEKALADADAAVAAAAADALAMVGSKKAGAALLAAKVPEGAEAVLDDARARCAGALAASGGRQQAEALYAALAAEDRPTRSRVLGLQGLAAVKSPKALPAVLAAVEAPDAELSRQAAALCASVPGEGAATALVGLYPKLPVTTQVALLAALADRKVSDALPVALQSLTSEDAALRATAIRAAALLGGGQAVQPLAEVAARGERSDQQLARGSLAVMPGKDVDAAVLEMARKGASEVRAGLMSVVAERKVASAPAFLLEMSRDPDAVVAAEAAKALSRAAAPAHYAEMVKTLLACKGESVRQALQDSLSASARRLSQADAAAEPVLAALPGASEEEKSTLIDLLAALGGEKALAEITKATAAEDLEVRRAAVQALADGCDDARALPILLNVAKGDADRVLRVQAMRGYLRILGQDAEAKPAEAAAQLADALAVAQRPEEKKQILGVLRKCRVPAAADLAARCLDDAALATEAADVVMTLASPLKRGSRTVPAVKGPEVAAAMARVAKLRGAGVPAPWSARDVGSVDAPGWTVAAGDRLTLRACGADIWGKADALHFVSQPLSGDGSIVARVESLEKTDNWAKAGVMIREGMEPGALCVFMCVTPANGASFQRRTAAGADTGSVKPGGMVAAPYWVKLTRAGDLFTGLISPDGQNWAKVGDVTLKMRKDVAIGVAATSHNTAATTRATFDHVVVAVGP